MRTTRFLSCAPILLALLVGLASTPAEARAKKPLTRGCTTEQLQSPKFDQCMKKLDQDILAGRSITHQPYCSSSGALLCCLEENGKILDGSCSVQRQSVPQENVSRPTEGLVDDGTAAPRDMTAPAPSHRIPLR